MKRIIIISFLLIIILSIGVISAAENTTDINEISSDEANCIEKIQNDDVADEVSADVENNKELLKKAETEDNEVIQENSHADDVLSI